MKNVNLKDILNDVLIRIKNGNNIYMCNVLLLLQVPLWKQTKILDLLWKHRVKSKLLFHLRKNSKRPSMHEAWYICSERKTRTLNIKRAIKSLNSKTKMK